MISINAHIQIHLNGLLSPPSALLLLAECNSVLAVLYLMKVKWALVFALFFRLYRVSPPPRCKITWETWLFQQGSILLCLQWGRKESEAVEKKDVEQNLLSWFSFQSRAFQPIISNQRAFESRCVCLCVFLYVCVTTTFLCLSLRASAFLLFVFGLFFPPSYFSEPVEPTLDLISFSNQPALGAMDFGLPCAFAFNTKRIIQRYRKSSNT